MSSKNHDVPDALLDSLLANYQKPEDLIGENGLLKRAKADYYGCAPTPAQVDMVSTSPICNSTVQTRGLWSRFRAWLLQ